MNVVAPQTAKSVPPAQGEPDEELSLAQRWAPLVLALIAGLAYLNSFSGVFLFDDRSSILDNESIRSLIRLDQVLTAGESATVVGRPLLNLSLAIDYALSGEDPWGYHVFNLVIHILAGWVLYGVIRRTLVLARFPKWINGLATELAFFSALLWLVHPLQTESVTYIVQRGEALVGLFYFLTLWCVIRGATETPATPWYVLSVIACYLGVATKEVMATAPVVVLLYDRTFLAGSIREAWQLRGKTYLGMFSSWVFLAGLMMTTGKRSGSAGFGLGMSSFDYAWTQCEFIIRYLGLTFWPDSLVFDYGIYITPSIEAGLPYAVGLACILLVAAWALIKRPAWGFLGCWFFLILRPTSSIVPLAGQTGAEHRMYLPLAGIVAGVVIGTYAIFHRLSHRRGSGTNLAARNSGDVSSEWGEWCARLCMVLAAGALAWTTVERNRVYDDELRMWQDVMQKRPNNHRAYNSGGATLMLRGDYTKAYDYYNRCLAIRPDYVKALGGRGTASMQLGNLPAAIQDFTRALTIDPRDLQARITRGVAFSMTKQWEKAFEDYDQAIAVAPRSANLYMKRAVTHAMLRRIPAALHDYTTAIELDPGQADAYKGRALLYNGLGKSDEALADFNQAIKARPNDPALYIMRAVLLASRQEWTGVRDDIESCRSLGGRVPEELLKMLPKE